MLDAGNAIKYATFKRTVCLNSSSKIPEEGPKETLITTTTAKEAVAGTQSIKDEVR